MASSATSRRAAAAAADGLAIGLLGGLTVAWRGVPAALPVRTRTQRLLALLVLRSGGIRRAAAGALLWPDAGEAEAVAALRRHVADLERYLADLTGHQPWVQRSGERLTWHPPVPCAVDAQRVFDAAIRLPDSVLQATAPEAAALTRQCARAATTPLAPGWPDAWVADERRITSAAAQALLRPLADRHAVDGDRTGAADLLDICTATDGPDPSTVRLTVALRHFEGDEPGARRAIAVLDRLDEGGGAAERTAGRLGWYAFDRLAARVARLLAVEAAPARPLSLFSHYVAGPPRIDGLLARAYAARWLTIDGPIGVGKSRLAHQALRQPVPGGPRGYACIDARRFGTLDALRLLVLAAVADGGPAVARSPTTRGPDDAAVRWIVIDNADGRRRAAEALADAVTQLWPHVRIVVTARAGGGGPTRHRWPVAPLPVAGASTRRSSSDTAAPPTGGLAGDEAGLSPAGQLLVARCREADLRFALGDGDGAHVEAIVARCAGLPLLIEHAAALVRAASLAEVARRPSSPPIAAPETAVSAVLGDRLSTFGAAYRALPPHLRDALRRSCIVDGDVSAASLRRVAGPESARDGAAAAAGDLAALTRAGWLVADSHIRSAGRAVAAAVRDHVLEVLCSPVERACLAQRSDDLRLSHLAAMGLGEPAMAPSDAAALAQARLPLAQTADRGPVAVARAVLAADALWRGWLEQGVAADAVAWLQSLPWDASGGLAPVVRSTGLDVLGMLHYACGELHAALGRCRAACDVPARSGTGGRAALHRVHLAGVEAMCGHRRAATRHALAAVAALDDGADATTRIDVLVLGADICLRSGALDDADRLLRAARRIDRRRIPRSPRAARILLRMGTIAIERGAYAEAVAVLRDAAERLARQGMARERNRARAELSLALRWLGQAGEAERVLAGVLRDSERADDRLLWATCLCNIADLWCDELQWARAEYAVRRIGTLDPRDLTADLQLDVVTLQAMLALQRRDRATLRDRAAVLRRRVSSVADDVSAGWALRTLGRLAHEHGDGAAAARHHAASIERFLRGGNRGGLVRSVEAAAAAVAALDPQLADAIWTACDAERRRIGAPRSPREAAEVVDWRGAAAVQDRPADGGPWPAAAPFGVVAAHVATWLTRPR